MKKIFILLFAILVGFSAFADRVEKSTAQVAAKNFYFERINSRDAVSFQSLRITSDFTVMAANEPAYYVFNINENDGFVIVAADDASVPVLGYSFKGHYTGENLPAEFKFWVDGYSEQIRLIRESQLKADLQISNEWNRYLTSNPEELRPDAPLPDVSPLITSQWNQDFPYNALCPEDEASGGSYGGRVPVGCVATALSQIMYYWRYPSQGTGYHCIYPTPTYGPQCADFGATTYDWNGMSDAPTKECYPAALISYHTGVAVDMDYGPDGSGAYISKIPSAISNYFGYASTAQYASKSGYSASAWDDLIKGDLDAGKPIEYAGFGSSGGHAWVCDGYQGTNYYHFNWGWGGSYDGYFYLNNLNPGGSTFTNNQQAVFHIEPSTSNYPPNCSGQTVVNTYDYGTIEDGSGPIANYQNNANCSWLIAPDDSVSKITLSFVRFAIDPSDEVKIYDGNSASATLLGTYTGTTLPGDLVSTGPAMFVTLTSNGSGTANGFLAKYQATTVPFCNSNTILTETNGDFDDGSGRFQYRNQSTCKWKIQPENAVSVTLVINSIDIEQDNDVVEVYDITTSQKLASFSGSTPPAPVTCPSGKMMVLFKTDNKNRGNGFNASWSTIVATPEVQPLDGLTIYPNPANDKVNFGFTLQEAGVVKADLISVSGITVISKNLGYRKGSVSAQMDISSVAPGVYFLRIISEKGTSTNRIIVE